MIEVIQTPFESFNGVQTLKIKEQHLEQTTKQASSVLLYETEYYNQQILSYVTLPTEQVDLYDPLIAMLDFIMFKINELKAACSKTEEGTLSVVLLSFKGFCRKMTKIQWFNIFIRRHFKTQFSLHHQYASEQAELTFFWKGEVISPLSATQGVNRKPRLNVGIRGNDSRKMQTFFLLLQMETSHSLANRCPCFPSRNTSFAGCCIEKQCSGSREGFGSEEEQQDVIEYASQITCGLNDLGLEGCYFTGWTDLVKCLNSTREH